VRLLSNLETDQRKLLQIVLIGQPELREKLNDRGLRQLRQRITVRYHLTPLSREETERYIAHRLRVAGAAGRPAFSPWAVRTIHRYSAGVPRLINAICDKALLYGFVNRTDRMDARAIRQAIRELEGNAA
jgi:general secretion pathway protein A